MSYCCTLEKAGIPTVCMGFPDQINFEKNVALAGAVPELRWIDTPRVGSGPERVATFYDKVMKALTDPLTAKEKESGLYNPPPPPRIIFTGTLLDAQSFFSATTPITNCRNCPIAKYTDGLPVVIPTEQAVKEMMTGTSHKADETIYRYTLNATAPGGYAKAASQNLYAQTYKASVENVATTAVMAGCKPEYMPVAMAIAASGGGSGNCPGTSGPMGYIYIVTGNIAKEIGMNPGQDALDNGNIANKTLGRLGGLMTVTFGGCITGQVRTDTGGPINNLCIPEDDDGLPQGWETVRESYGYSKTQNALLRIDIQRPSWGQYAPSSFRALASDGSGGMGVRIGTAGTGKPGNFLSYVETTTVTIGANMVNGSLTMIMHYGMAASLHDLGFKTKAAVYQWMWDNFFITNDQLKTYGWWDHNTNQGKSIEPLSKKSYNDLPGDYKLHVFGYNGPSDNFIIVGAGFGDEVCYCFNGATRSIQPIDVWK